MTPERWQQITGMFHAALLRNSDQRRTFLQDACGADEALRAEVEAMLAAHDNAGDPASIPAVAVSEQMLRLQSGSAVGRYKIDALIGAGGMGQVYRAHDPSIERDVAIKVLPAGLCRRCRTAAPVRTGSPRVWRAQSSQRADAIRRRHGRRPPVSGDGTARRRDAARLHRPRRDAGGAGLRDRGRRSHAASPRRTREGSCTAISSPRT